MFLLDSLMISGIRWALQTVVTAAEAEMNDDTALREQLLEAEMRREVGEISDQAFGEIEADLLARIREIKERREGGSGPLAFGGSAPIDTGSGDGFQIEASVSGDFHDPGAAPHTTVVASEPSHGERIAVLDMEPGDASPPSAPGLPLTVAPGRRSRPRRHAPPRKTPSRPRARSKSRP